ncbi:MAG: hypothetical protein MJE68_03075 [Proteobacteria bacterium]|nr:hypothetical protein [Pseudomonadota bacterium]
MLKLTRSFLLAVTMLALLGGCGYNGAVQSRLDATVGKPVLQVRNYLGFPTQRLSFDVEEVYVWQSGQYSGTISCSYGTCVNTPPKTACVIKISADRNGIVQYYSYEDVAFWWASGFNCYRMTRNMPEQ